MDDRAKIRLDNNTLNLYHFSRLKLYNLYELRNNRQREKKI